MRVFPKAWLLSLAALSALGCGGDGSGPIGPGDLTQADIAGTWNVTQLQFSEDAPGNREFDVVADGGATATITIDAEGDYTLVITDSAGGETQTGHFEVTADGVHDTSDGDPELVWQFTLDGNTLTGQTDDGGFDFEQDGSAEEPAAISVTLQKMT